MTINRLGPIEQASRFNKAKTTERLAKQPNSDTVAVSEEARRSATLQQTADIVRAVPDLRMDRVEEAKIALQNPDYLDDRVIETVADNILEALGVS